MIDIALIQMPVASPNHPNLGLSILRDEIRARGRTCEIFYFNLDFFDYFGPELYQIVSDQSVYNDLLGEWLFSCFFYEKDLGSILADIQRLAVAGSIEPSKINPLLNAIERLPEFIDLCLQKILRNPVKIFGFSTTFEQNLASLCLAREVKRGEPSAHIAFGGANCEGEMGHALLDNFPFIDAVFSGRSERIFSDHCLQVLEAGTTAVRREIFDSSAMKSFPTDSQDSYTLKHSSKAPDFDDFLIQFQSFEKVSESCRLVPLLETSIGCWWGEKHHCTFCGLNGASMKFTSKDWRQVFDDINYYLSKYGREILVVDNILDMNYLRNLMPALGELQEPPLMHFEVKGNLSFKQMTVLAKAGVRKLQPGLESLDTAALQHMRKGVSAIQNVQFLKTAAEVGVYVDWLMLYGFPDASADSLAGQTKLLPMLHHLTPPALVGIVRADRFSPYFDDPKKFEISIKPLESYTHIYDLPMEEIERLAYHFEIEGPNFDPTDVYQLKAGVDAWKKNSEAQLYFALGSKGQAVVDTRGDVEVCHELDRCQAELLKNVDKISSRKKIASLLGDYSSGQLNEAEEVLAQHNLLFVEGELLLGLPLRQPGHRRAIDPWSIPTGFEHSFAAQA